jgi:hypothetical protein
MIRDNIGWIGNIHIGDHPAYAAGCQKLTLSQRFRAIYELQQANNTLALALEYHPSVPLSQTMAVRQLANFG